MTTFIIAILILCVVMLVLNSIGTKVSISRCVIEIMNDNFDDAIKSLETFIKSNPDDHIAYGLLSYAYSRKEEYDKSLELAKYALQLDSSNPIALTTLANYSLMVDYNLIHGLDYVNYAICLTNQNEDCSDIVYIFAITTYCVFGYFDDARNLLTSDVVNRLNRNSNKTIEEIIHEFEIKKAYADGYLTLSGDDNELLSLIQDEKTKVDNYNKAISLWPFHAKAYYNLGLFYLKNNEFEKVEKHLNMLKFLCVSDLYYDLYDKFMNTKTEHMDVMKAFDVLGASKDMTKDKIKEIYRNLVKLWHPDRFYTEKEKYDYAQKKLCDINNAYSLLQSMSFA